MKNVVVIFQATQQATESLALALALAPSRQVLISGFDTWTIRPMPNSHMQDTEHCARKIFAGRRASPLSWSRLSRWDWET